MHSSITNPSTLISHFLNVVSNREVVMEPNISQEFSCLKIFVFIQVVRAFMPKSLRHLNSMNHFQMVPWSKSSRKFYGGTKTFAFNKCACSTIWKIYCKLQQHYSSNRQHTTFNTQPSVKIIGLGSFIK